MMNDEMQPAIKTWQQFEQRILAFNRRDWKAEWNADPQKFKDRIKAIRLDFFVMRNL